MEKTRTEFDLETFIPYRLNRVSEHISLGFSKIYRGEYGMTRPEWRVLANLGQHQKLTAKRVGEISGQHKTKVSRAVSALENRKWLIRTQNPDDRREEWLELTRAGTDAYRRIATEGKKHDASLLARLGATKARALLAALDALEEISRTTPPLGGK